MYMWLHRLSGLGGEFVGRVREIYRYRLEMRLEDVQYVRQTVNSLTSKGADLPECRGGGISVGTKWSSGTVEL